MKIKGRQFTIPRAAIDDALLDRQSRLLLILLFSESNFNGMCSPGYERMRSLMASGHGKKTSHSTVNNALKNLSRLGWIRKIEKTQTRMKIYLANCPRRLLRNADIEPKNIIRVLP